MSERLMAAIAFAPVAPALASLVARAGSYAGQQGHRSVKLEHLLFALTEDGEAVHLLETCGVDVSRLRTEIAQYLDHHEDRDPSGETRDPPPHGELIRAIQHGAAAARGRAVGPSVVLAAIVGEGTTTAASLLSVQGFSFQAAVTALQQIAARSRAQQAAQPQQPQPQPTAPPQTQPQPVALRPVAHEPSFAASASAEDLINTARRRVEAARHHAMPPPASPPQDITSATPLVPVQPAPPPVAPAFSSVASHNPAPAYSPVSPPAPPPQPLRVDPPTYAPPRPEPATERTYPPHREPPPAQHYQPMPVPQPVPRHAPPQPVAQPAPGPVPQPPPRAQLHAAPPGDYARPPAPRLEQPPQRRPQPATQPATQPAGSGQPQHARTIEIGRLIENVPRRATVGEARTIEVRLRRAEIAAYMPSHAQRTNPDGRLIHAVCVRLRAPDGGLILETLSPETAWLDADTGGLADEFATWRWRMTPTLRGRRKLVLGVTVRRVGEEGLTAETNLPEQVFEVTVAASVGRAMTWAGGLAAALVAGFVAGFFGNAIVSGTLSAIARLGAG